MNPYNRILRVLAEAHEAYRDRKGSGDESGFAGPIARRYGKTRGSEGIKDPLVKREAKAAKKRLDKKVGRKTNPQAQHMVQSALLKRRKANKGRGLELAPMSKSDSAALSQREKEMPGDKSRSSRRAH